MQALTQDEFDQQGSKAYKAVFASENPYDEPFQPNIHPRLLLYGFRYGLQEPWLGPVTAAIRSLGEEGFYLTLLRRTGKEPWHWYVPLSEAALYVSEIFPVENSIYSVNGKWGIICSEEDHALVGGANILIDRINAAVPDVEDRLNWFLDAWKHYHEKNKVEIDWILPMLSHVYGPEKARDLLLSAKMNWLLSEL